MMRRFLFILFSSLVLAASAWGAYTIPHGIPSPASRWGSQDPINDSPPAAPSPWNSPTAGYYYVNYQTGSDSGNTYGTPASPRQTIPATIPAGSYVEVHGTYNRCSGGSNDIYGTGTNAAFSANSAGPVWIVGLDSDKPTFSGCMIDVYGSYVYLYNLNVVSGGNYNGIQVSTTSAGYGADHIAIRNCDIDGGENQTTAMAGISVRANSGYPVTDVVVYNNTVHDLGPATDADVDAVAVDVASYCSYVWVLHNTLRDACGGGVQYGANSPGPQYCYFGDNTVYNVRQAGLWVKYGTDIIFSENTVHDVYDRCVGGDTSPSKGMGAQYLPTRVWFLFNTVYNTRYGLRVASTDGNAGSVYAIGNLFYDASKDLGGACFSDPDGTDSWDPAAVHLHGAATRYLVGNTISRSWSGIHLSNTNEPTTVIENNIIEGMTDAQGYYLYTENGTGLSGWLTFRNNILYGSAGGSFKRSSTAETLAQWQASTGLGGDCAVADPVFKAKASNDFTLNADSSPAYNTGILSDAYATFNSTYSIGIAYDRAGAIRPAFTYWDIGAYELGSDSGEPTPATAMTIKSGGSGMTYKSGGAGIRIIDGN